MPVTPEHLPGRPKTDTLDAVWLCKLAERQLLRPSFVPPPPIRQLREVTRYRADLVAARTAETQRVEELLEDAQSKLSVVASDIFGVSGRAMLAALVAGERDPKGLAQLARTRLRAKLSLLEEAFCGCFTDQHAFLLAKMLARVDTLDAKLAELIAPLAGAVERLDAIPGLGQLAVQLLLAELGVDMTRFPTAGQLVSWAKSTPGVRASAGKPKGRGSTGHGNPYLARVLGEAAVAAGKTETFLGNATGGSPAAAVPSGPSSRSAGPSWSLSGTCWPTRPHGSRTWAPASTTPASVLNAPSATTSASWRPSATRSPSNPPPDRRHHWSTRLTRIGSGLHPDTAARPLTMNFRIKMRPLRVGLFFSKSSAPSRARGAGGITDQNGGASLKSPPRSTCRSRPLDRSPLPRWLARSTLAVAHLSEAPTSSASSSVTDRLSPSGVSQLRWRSRPVTRTRSPLVRDSARFSAWPRHTLTLKNEVSPSRHWPSCWTRWVTATLRLATGMPVWVKRSSGVLNQVAGQCWRRI
jgi:transposase